MGILDANTNKGYTQIQIMPSHALARRGMILVSIFFLLSTITHIKEF